MKSTNTFGICLMSYQNALVETLITITITEVCYTR